MLWHALWYRSKRHIQKFQIWYYFAPVIQETPLPKRESFYSVGHFTD